jgi:filamentous hemagglutinin family protein
MASNRDRPSKAFGAKGLSLPTPGQRWSWGVGIVLGIGGAMLMSCNRALAQITPDATLGVEHSVVTPNTNVRGFPAELIQGGATRGTNLFHSFQEFNVGNGQRVYFANPIGIENILSRVTGNNLSNILETLGVDGGANLFLLNPNGIIFGENATLDIAGSFVASTANVLVFENGTRFSATNPEAPPLLKISITPGLQYGTNQPRTTIANSGNLAVGQNLTLSAGNLDLQGQLAAGGDLSLLATDTVKVRDSVASPFIASANGNLLVQGNQGVDIFALNHPNSGLFSGGNMVLRSANTVGGDAHYWSGGSFRIEKLDGSLGDLYSPYDPIIRSLGDVSFDAYQGTSLHILAGGEVNIGTVIITGAETGAAGIDYLQETVQLSNSKEVSINGSLQPTLDIRAGVAPASIGVPGVTGFDPTTDRFFGQGFLTGTPTSANITIGDVLILPPNGLVFISNQYQPNIALPGGDINVTGAGVFGFGIYAPGLGGNGSSVILDSRRNIAIINSGINPSSNAGNAGDITLLANETVSVNNSLVFSNIFGAGEGGDINIQARQLLVTDGAQVGASTYREGKGGSLIVNASQGVQLMGISANGQVSSGLFATTLGKGDGGNVEITTPQLLVKDGALVNVGTYDEGKGGSLIVNASQGVQLIGASANGQFRSGLSAETTGKGDGGNVEITTPELLLKDSAVVSVSTFGEGDAGNVNIDVRNTIAITGFKIVTFNGRNYLSSSSITSGVGLGGTGNAGDIKIKAGALLLADTAGIFTGTTGQGNAGNIFIQADDAISLTNLSQIRTVVEPGGVGKGGDIDIQARRLSLTNGSQVIASLFRTVGSFPGGQGRGGDIRINASDSVNIFGVSSFQLPVPVINPLDPSVNLPTEGFSSGLFTSTERGASGQGGDITVNTRAFRVADGAVVNAQTLNPSHGGNITINTKTFEAAGGGQVLTLTRSSGRAGSITLNATDKVTLSGSDSSFADRFARYGRDVVNNEGAASGLFASATDGSGQAGDLGITTGELNVRDGAQVTVSSPQGQAGNLSITANSLTLNRGTISAVTGTSSPEGGANITLSGLEFLRMDNESLISASALGDANGGNITIDSTLIVATPPTGPEGSDIIANAEQGNGGRVNVTTQGLFGIEFRPQRTPKNDITVSSTFGLSGEYVLNTPGVDPSRGLAELPTNVVDASQQIDRRCTPEAAKERGSFTITGRGGLPPNPNEPLQGESVITNWITLDSEENNNTPPKPTTPSNSAPKQLVEAQSWSINEQGQVVLTASAPNATPQSAWLASPECNPAQSSTVTPSEK